MEKTIEALEEEAAKALLKKIAGSPIHEASEAAGAYAALTQAICNRKTAEGINK
jgi:hypothetical protein